MTASAISAVPPGIAPAGRRLHAPPGRASDVQLFGELAGSGYREAPTLVRRGDGQLIKLTPLLYELIDAIDGARGYEELAEELSRRVGKRATVEDVRFLVERKLRPLGVLQGPDGAQPDVERSNPLLALRPRVVVSKPELTRKLTAPFVWLFKPVVMVPILAAFAAICGWLFFDKGLSSALHQAFYEPGLILAIWGLVVVSAAFHEIGHAAACRYGGAKPGVIGGGLYLVWPAFYTEVSDSYRLDRRGRLRVDLGGLYFSAIFAVATLALWRLTGVDALLLVIAVQILQMVRQLTPFIRADGYHIVSDLVGVPDLFAHIKPTVLGMLPTRWGRPKHRALKPWARAVVTGWVAVTVPTLVVVLGFMVLLFPRLAATAWDSIGLRWAETTAYWSDGDPAGIAMSAISIFLVALPALGVVYIVSTFGRRIWVRTWRGTAGRPGLRALALLAMGALLGLLAWAWWPGDNYRPIDAHERGSVPSLVQPPPLEPLQTVQLSYGLPSRSTAPIQVPFAGESYLVSPSALPAAGSAFPTAPPTADGDSTEAPGAPNPVAEQEPPFGPGAAGQSPAVAPADSPAPTAPGVAPAEPAPAPAPAAPNEGPAWPLPFDPPAPPEPGGNQATAVNTTDGSTVWEFAFGLSLLEAGATVDQVNEAYAFASCENCLTGAVAFQVLLIVGQVDEIIPWNVALALNYDCSGCITYAFGYQIVASITQAPEAEIQRQLDLAMDRLHELQENAGSMSGQEIYLELESIREDYLNAIEGILAVEAGGSTAAASQATAPSGTGTPAPPTESPPAPAVGSESDTSPEPAGGSTADAPSTDGTMDGPAAESPADAPATENPTEEQAADCSTDEPGPATDGATEEPAAGGEGTESTKCADTSCADTSTQPCPAETESTGTSTVAEPTVP